MGSRRIPEMAATAVLVVGVFVLSNISHAQPTTTRAAGGPTAHVRSVTASAVFMDARHELLDGDLIGGAIDVRLPIGGRSAMARLGATRAVGDGRRTDVTCVGLILDPGACPPEPVRDEAQFTAVSAGLSDRLLGWRRVSVDLAADFRVALVDVTTRGQTSGRQLSADRWLWGADIALDAAWSPWSHLPIAFQVGAAGGGVKPVIRDGSVDNYAPFRDAFGTTSVRVGMRWRGGSGSR